MCITIYLLHYGPPRSSQSDPVRMQAFYRDILTSDPDYISRRRQEIKMRLKMHPKDKRAPGISKVATFFDYIAWVFVQLSNFTVLGAQIFDGRDQASRGKKEIGTRRRAGVFCLCLLNYCMHGACITCASLSKSGPYSPYKHVRACRCATTQTSHSRPIGWQPSQQLHLENVRQRPLHL